MNNYQLTVNNVKKTGLPLTIVTLCCCMVMVVSGCNDIFDHPNTGKTTETGTILLSISDNAPNGQSTERTIMPTTKLSDFAEFKLDFAAQTPGNTNLSATWTSSSGTVSLPVGTWKLTVTAYLAGEGSLLEAAKSEIKTIELTSGAAVPLSVQLFPIEEEGKGTFSWNISFNGSFNSAIMEIWHTGDDVKFKTVTFGVTNNTNQNSQTSLTAGEYRVIFTLSNGEEEVAINEILHVYKNMESSFTKTFTDNHFPVTLLNFVLSALEEHNLTEAGITAEHFPYLDVNGVNSDNFEGLVGWFDKLCTSVTTPHDLDALKVLVDAALVGMAGDDTYFVNATHYGYRAEAEAAIAGLIKNGTDITFEWTGDNAVTVHIGAYEVGVVFDGAISLLPPLTGTVSISGTAHEGLRLTANISNLGGSGVISYQWKRGDTNIGANSNIYIVQAADGGYTITVTVTRTGNSGGVTSPATDAVSTGTVTAGIVINLIPINEWELTGQTAQVNANVNKVFTVTGTYTTYRWYLDGVLVGTSSSYTFNKPAEVYQLVVVVTNSSGERRSGRCRITVSAN